MWELNEQNQNFELSYLSAVGHFLLSVGKLQLAICHLF